MRGVNDKAAEICAKEGNGGKYDKIIGLPHHVSKVHPRLGTDSYAAQFSPFAALTGYDEIVSEAERTTDCEPELIDDARYRLSEKLGIVLGHLAEDPEITVTYFVPDKTKAGGSFSTVTGTVRKFDACERKLLMSDGSVILADRIIGLTGDVLNRFLPDDV